MGCIICGKKIRYKVFDTMYMYPWLSLGSCETHLEEVRKILSKALDIELDKIEMLEENAGNPLKE